MGNKTTMWPKREPIKYAVLLSKRVLHLVSSSLLLFCFLSSLFLSISHLTLVAFCLFFFLVPRANRSLLTSLFSSSRTREGSEEARTERSRGWHCGSLNGSRPQTDTKPTGHFRFREIVSTSQIGARARYRDAPNRSGNLANSWYNVGRKCKVRDNKFASVICSS